MVNCTGAKNPGRRAVLRDEPEDSYMRNIAPRDASEIESLEQREWIESLEYVIDQGDRG